MQALIWLVDNVIWLYTWILIAHVVMSWLIAFNVVNARQPFVRQLGMTLWRLTEPVLAPIRRVVQRFLPNLGGIDISPIIAILLLGFLRVFLKNDVLIPIAAGTM